VTYLLAAFLVTLAALAALVTVTTRDGFQREREGVTERMRAASKSIAAGIAASDVATRGFLATMAKEPAFATLDPEVCTAALASLSALASQGRIGVVGPDGAMVCTVGNQSLPLSPIPAPGRTIAETPLRGPERDPGTGLIVETLAVPVGSSGAMLVAVFPTGVWDSIDVSALPPETLVLVLDADRDDIAVASATAKRYVGRHFEGTALNAPLPPSGVVSDALDGQPRLYFEVVDEKAPRHVLVGLPRSVALADAQKQLQRTLGFGAIAVLLVGALGVLLHHRITGPVRRLTRRIREVGAGSDGWAPVEGPAELAQLAEAFNDMLMARRAHESDLRHRAAHDGLTGLPNRSRVTDELAAAVAVGRPPAVLFLDLDRFKYVNDSHGHSVGDELLVALSGRLTRAVRSDCMVARFGGDEFVILAPCEERQALSIADRVLRAVSDPFDVEGHRLYVTGSVGIVIAEPEDSAEDLIRYADTAMYRAKAAGRAGSAVFDAHMRQQS
jgi:diguanylate cyclase (GGDEF)-like protein